jgi:carboxypeptidase T
MFVAAGLTSVLAYRGEKTTTESTRSTSSGTVIVFAPHPDDETLGASGVIYDAVRSGREIKVVYVTVGDAYEESKILFEKNHPTEAYDRDGDGDFDMRDFGWVRREEATNAMESLGLSSTNLFWLGYPDGYLYDLLTTNYDEAVYSAFTKTSSVPYTFAESEGASYSGVSILRDLTIILTLYTPSEVYVSYEEDRHSDHQATTYFVTMALARANIYPTIYKYLVHYTHFSDCDPEQDYVYEISWLLRHRYGSNYEGFSGDVKPSTIYRCGVALSEGESYGWTSYSIPTTAGTVSSLTIGIRYRDKSWFGDGPTFYAYNWIADTWDDINGAPLPKGENVEWYKEVDATKYIKSGWVSIYIYADGLDRTDIAYVFADYTSSMDIFVTPKGLPSAAKSLSFGSISFSEEDKLKAINSYTSQVDQDGPYLRAFAKNNELFWAGFKSWDVNRYHSYFETEYELYSLAHEHKDIVKLESIGNSWQDRRIWAMKISDTPDVEDASESDVLYLAEHHAREIITLEVAMYWIHFLADNYDSGNPNSAVTQLINEKEIWIVPLVNPDGHNIVLTKQKEKLMWTECDNYLWRKNARDNDNSGKTEIDILIKIPLPPACLRMYASNDGVDLNRNYGYQWGAPAESGSHNPSDYTYVGPYAFSEPETSAIRDFVNTHDFVAALSWHSFGGAVLYPWGYVDNNPTNNPHEGLLEELAEGMARRAGYDHHQSYDCPYSTSGDTTDWLYSRGTYAFTIEVYGRNEGNTGSSPYPRCIWYGSQFNPPESGIVGVAENNKKAALYLASRANNIADVIAGDIVPVDGGSMSTSLASYADLHVYDPLDNHVGKNYETGLIETEIVGAHFYKIGGVQHIDLSTLMTGDYRVELVGTGTGPYKLEIEVYQYGTLVRQRSYDDFISDDLTHAYLVTISLDQYQNLDADFVDLGVISLYDELPFADAGHDLVVYEGQKVQLDGTGSSDPDGIVISYVWTFDGHTLYGPNPTFTWYDNTVVTVTLAITTLTIKPVYGKGGSVSYRYIYRTATDTMTVTVLNKDPVPSIDAAYMYVDFTLRVAGEKWHDVDWTLHESTNRVDWEPIAHLHVERYPGSPNVQSQTVYDIYINMERLYKFIATYNPYDDPINGQIQGSTPIWIDLTFKTDLAFGESIEDSTERIHHNFNVEQSTFRDTDRWIHCEAWCVDLSPWFVGHWVTFDATITDVGTDDFWHNGDGIRWDFGDGSPYHNESVHAYRAGGARDPYPSPYDKHEGSYPMTVRVTVYHKYEYEGDFIVTLKAIDDDGGTAEDTLDIEAIHTEHVCPVR